MQELSNQSASPPPLAVRLAFGFAELGPNAAEVLIRVSLLIHYTEVVGLAPGLAGLALSIGVLWDAICDPWVGRLSDRMNYRGQRRRPLLIPGALITAAFLVMLFAPIRFSSQLDKFIYLTCCYCIFSIASAVFTIPLVALAGEITDQSKIRNQIFALRLIFANFGFVLATALPAAFIATKTIYDPNFASSIWIGVFVALGGATIFFSSNGFDRIADKNLAPATELKSHFASVFKNQQFVSLLLGYMVANIGLTLNSSLAMYYYKYFLQLDEIDIRLVLTAFMVIFCLSIPLWAYLERYYSYKTIIGLNIGALGIMSAFVYPLLPEESLTGPFCCAFFGGVFVGSIVLLEIQVARIVNATSADQNSSVSFGTYFGVWKMGSKITRAFALVATGKLLDVFGLMPGVAPSAKTAFHISLLFGPGVGIFLLAAVFTIFYFDRQYSKDAA